MPSLTATGVARWGSTTKSQSFSTIKELATTDDEETICIRTSKYKRIKIKLNNSSNGKLRRKKKPTHTRRKEEKEMLVHQLESLQAQLQILESHALVMQTQRQQMNDCLTRPVPQATVMDVIQQQQHVLASLQGLLSGYMQLMSVNPIETFIKLGRHPLERRETLLVLHPHKVRRAEQFISQRRNSVDPSSAYTEEARFETPDGQFCQLHFSVTPLGGAKSVKAIFDILLFHAFNFEIIMSEAVGNITIREDDDSNNDPTVSHHRLVSTSVRGVLIEMNSVVFSGFYEATPTRPAYGIIVSDTVDEDELYPYRPLERMRTNMATVMLVTTCVDNDAKEEQQRATNPVLMRWRLSRLQRPQFEIPSIVMHEIRDNMCRAVQEVSKNIVELCGGREAA